MTMSMVVGYLGELYVLQKLVNEVKQKGSKLAGTEVKHLGRQSGYDILFGELRIDVKTSNFKVDVEKKQGMPKYWAWTLIPKTRKKKGMIDWFVCLSLHPNHNVDSYYCIRMKDVDHFPGLMGRFNNVEHGFGLTPTPIPPDVSQGTRDFFEISENLHKKGLAQRVKPGESLTAILTS